VDHVEHVLLEFLSFKQFQGCCIRTDNPCIKTDDREGNLGFTFEFALLNLAPHFSMVGKHAERLVNLRHHLGHRFDFTTAAQAGAHASGPSGVRVRVAVGLARSITRDVFAFSE